MNERDVAIEAAGAAATILRDHARPNTIHHKGPMDLVTEVDLACEAAIRRVLAQHTPDVPVLGEEGGGAGEALTRWVVDPLDGTTNFVHGIPHYAVSVALQIDGMTEVGVVHELPRDRILVATRGQGASCGGVRLRVSEVRDLSGALCATGFPYDRSHAGRCAAVVRATLLHARGLRRMGSAALDLAYVAEGRLDAYAELNLAPWDTAAGILLVEEAGGKVTATPGPGRSRSSCPIASNGWVHDVWAALFGSAIDPEDR
ncbi:MAG TPA: inositol monophosphatase [Deltaproteobacteria bacterium]|nr:inositol monophosphatase [Deltaproteobacteria bacterium]